MDSLSIFFIICLRNLQMAKKVRDKYKLVYLFHQSQIYLFFLHYLKIFIVHMV